MKKYLKKFLNKNKTAFVVGGSGFIGKEVSLALWESGAKVINLDIHNAFKKKKRSVFQTKP